LRRIRLPSATDAEPRFALVIPAKAGIQFLASIIPGSRADFRQLEKAGFQLPLE